MPQFFNDSIDDPIVFDTQPRIEGVDSYSRASIIPQNQVSYLKNVELESSGIAKSRRGAWYLSTRTYGTIHAIKYIKDDDWNDPLFIFGNGHIWVENSDDNSVLSLNTYDSTVLPENCSCAEINGHIFFSTGAGSITAISLTNVATDKLLDGNADHIVDNNGNRIILYQPVSTLTETDDPTAVRLLTAHKFRLFCVQGVDTVISSNILPVPGSAPFPDPASATLGSIRVGKGDSDRIMALVPFKDHRLAVLKEYSLFVIDADPSVDPASWVIKQISDRVGCVGGGSAVSVGDDIVFLSRDGVRSIGTAFQQEQIATSDPISFPISDQIELINWDAAHKSVATFWRGRYILSVPMGSSTDPDTVLVYNTNLKQWAGVWTGWKPSDFEIIELTGQPRKLVWADRTNNNVLAFRDWVDKTSVIEDDFADNLDGTFSTVPFKLLTRAMSFGDPVSPKTLDFIEVEFFRSKSYADIIVIPDDGDEIVIDAGQVVDTGSGELRLDFDLPAVLGLPGVIRHTMSALGLAQGREFQICIQSTPDEKLSNTDLSLYDQRFLSVRNLTLGAYIDTIETQQ